jgi:hypothetical protein
MSGGSRYGQGLYGRGPYAFGYTDIIGGMITALALRPIDAVARIRVITSTAMLISVEFVGVSVSRVSSIAGSLVTTVEMVGSRVAGDIVVSGLATVSVGMRARITVDSYWQPGEPSNGLWQGVTIPPGFWQPVDEKGVDWDG